MVVRDSTRPPALVLAAGLGTRLRPLTDELAKPLVPIGDEPLLGHVIRGLRSSGVPRIVANAHHRAADVVSFCTANGVAVSEEAELLGTAGGLRRAGELLGEGDVLVYNGDIYAPAFEARLLGADAGAAVGVLLVRPRAKGEGNVGLLGDGRVVRLRRESFAEEEIGGEFLGIHLVSAELRAILPERGCLVGDGYLPALRRGAQVRAVCTDIPFVDVGTLDAYLAANVAWLKARGAKAFAHPTARVTCALEDTVVGPGAEAVGDGALTRCVVWPGARAHAPLRDAVVTARGVVHVDATSGTLRP